MMSFTEQQGFHHSEKHGIIYTAYNHKHDQPSSLTVTSMYQAWDIILPGMVSTSSSFLPSHNTRYRIRLTPNSKVWKIRKLIHLPPSNLRILGRHIVEINLVFKRNSYKPLQDCRISMHETLRNDRVVVKDTETAVI
ncbi:hypothetical protein V6N13_088010 [Hibiscus sabdariffa]